MKARKNYRHYVMKARNLIGEVEAYQAKIAEMALKATKDKKHTITDFARDIEIPRKTLDTWVKTYERVIVRAGVKKPDAVTWAKANKVHKYLMARNKDQDGRIKKYLPKRKLLKMINEVNDPDRNQYLLIDRSLSSAKHIAYTVKKADLSKVSPELLRSLLESLGEAAEYVHNYLSMEKKAS